MSFRASRAVLAGLCGGAFAALIDFFLASGRLATFLPSGSWKLLVFLIVLYSALATSVAALLVVLHRGFTKTTDLGLIEAVAFFGAPPQSGRRRVAYIVALVGALILHGLLTRQIALYCLQTFHHRALTAGVVGVGSIALVIPLGALVLLLAQVLDTVLRVGPAQRIGFTAPVAIEAAGWIFGLGLCAGVNVGLLLMFLDRPRMTTPLRALNMGLWSPVVLAVSLLGTHFVARHLGRERPAKGFFVSVAGTVAVVTTLVVAPALAFAAWQWTAVRQLDARPWLALGLIVVGTIGFALSPLAKAPSRILLLLPPVLLVFSAQLGKNDRVRKAGVAFSGLCAGVIQTVQRLTDFDRDHYSALLGGGDCNDFDPNVHPGAFDWPDDGIDQNCNGHEASLQASATRPRTPLPDGVPKDLNILLITIDALRSDHVGAYGYKRPTTPNLDQLAGESALFLNSWAHAPSTRYSVPAILTGRYPSTIAVGSAWWPPNLLPENRLMAEIFKERGYYTGAYLPYYYFNRSWGLDQGFNEYDISLQNLHSMGGDPALTRGTSAKQLADLDIAFIEKHKGEKFFLWSHYYDTHYFFETHPDLPEANFGSDEPALYDGEIRFTDHQIGRLFAALKAAGLWDKTIIVVTSDHGEGFGEHGLPKSKRHGYHLYRNETAVPLIVRVPGLPARKIEDLVGHVDILPTLLNLIGQDAEPQLLGESVVDLMLGQKRPRRVFQEVWYEGPTSKKAVADSKWHFIRNLVPEDTRELYATTDTEEIHDRSASGETAEAELDEALAAWTDAISVPKDFRERVAGNVSSSEISSSEKRGVIFGDFLELAGVEVKTPTVKPGETLEVHLILHGKKPIPEGWKFFTHVNAPNGQRINADHDPVENFMPLQRIQPGQWIRDRIKVSLPATWPPGIARVEVGLWQKSGRAKAVGPNVNGDAALAATISVQP